MTRVRVILSEVRRSGRNERFMHSRGLMVRSPYQARSRGPVDGATLSNTSLSPGKNLHQD